MSKIKTQQEEFFKLGISIDCVVFGFDGQELKVLLIERGDDLYKGYWALPGNLLSPDKDLNSSVNEVLNELTGIKDLFFEQVETFGEVDRHPMGRVLTVSYYTLVKISDYKLNPSSFASEAQWVNLKDVKELAFDHNKILDTCFNRLKESVKVKPIGFELLPPKFTLTELLLLYQAILGIELDPRNFRKKILKMNLLRDCNELQTNVSHRPAKLYEFDTKQYKELKKGGFVFEM